jgi:hypothetical protein
MRGWKLCVSVVLVVAACEVERRAPADTTARGDSVMVDSSADSLRLGVAAPARVQAGRPVAIALEVENISGRALQLYLAGREPTAEVIVRDANGAAVWNSLSGVALPAILRLEPLAAGGSLRIAVEWNQRNDAGQPVAPGRYTIEAALLAESAPLPFAAAALEITP